VGLVVYRSKAEFATAKNRTSPAEPLHAGERPNARRRRNPARTMGRGSTS